MTKNGRRRGPARQRARLYVLTVSHTATPQRGWYVGEVLEARNVYSQARSLPKLRENLAEVIDLLLQDVPPSRLFRSTRRRQVTSPGDPTEKLVLMLR